jgi:hypothetical protein
MIRRVVVLTEFSPDLVASLDRSKYVSLKKDSGNSFP